MTLSLNPTLTQNKEKNTEIQVANTDLVTQHKPMPQLEAQNTDLNTQDNTESNTQAQEPIHQTQNTTQGFDINNKAYQDFIKAKLAAQKGAEILNDKFSNNDYMQGAYRAVKESAKSFNPLDEETKERYNKGAFFDATWEAWNTMTGQTALRNYNKEKLKEKEAQKAVYSYLEKYGTSKESIGLKNYEEDKLKEQKLIKGIQNKEIKDLSEEEKDYLRDSESNISRFIDYLFTDENKNLQKYKNNLTRQNINHELVKKLVILDSQNSSIFNLTEDLQKEARQKTLTSGTKLAQMYGYDRLEYDAQAQDYVLIDKEGNKLYPDMQSVFNNLGTALEANYYDVVSSFIPVGKAAQVTKGGIKLTQSLAKTALQSAGMSAIASPLDYINMQNETAQEGDIQDILKHSAGNALGSAVGVYVGAGIAKGASKAYNSIKDLKNLSTDDLKNIKISKYLDNEEASIHRKLAKFNKSEIDSNYEIFKGLQSDRIISKEMKDPTFMGNFMDKISNYNVLKHLSSKKESQDKLLSALFSNKELAREFAGKLTSEEATIVNKAIHAMGENFTRLSKEYEQQIIDEYAKSGKIKGLNPHIESNTQTNKDSVINLPEVYKHMLDEIDKQAKQDYKTSIDNLQNALNDTDFKATLLQGYKQVTDDAIESLGLDNQLTNTLIRETQKLESKANISLSEAIELRKNINEIMRNYEKSSSDLKKFRANKHLDNIKDNIDNAIKNALDSKVAQNEANQMGGVRGLGRNEIEISPITQNKSLPELRQELKDTLLPILNKDIINEQTQAIAQISNKGLKKMMSDKAILKSITNGFTKEEHFAIAKDIENLYRQAKHIATQDDLKGNDTNLKIHRYSNEVVINEKPAKVLITAKEYLENGKKIYSVELDKIASVKLNPSGKGLTEYPKSKDIDTATFDAPNGISNPTQNKLTKQEADELFSNFQQANKNYAQIKESLNDKFAKALTKGMNKKDLDSRLTIEQWKQRVLDTQWGDSVKGLENTIFKNFNPRMQKHTQMLTILRALDRNVKLNDDTFPIDFTKILSDIENLEKLTLHPEIYPILDTFKSYAKSYQFAQEISKAKALENQVGGGALATTLEGRIKVFLTNRLFKKLFAFIPYIGDNAAITKALQSAIKDLKYPSEITLETLKVLNKADLDKGFKPIKDKENKPRFEYKANTPLSDKELQSQIRGNTQILTPKDTSEIEALASNPLIQNMERQAKFNEELTQKISQFEANKENIQQDILNNLVVATQEIKQNTELLKQLAQQLTQNNPIHTPNKSIIKAEANNDTYFIINDKNNITAIEKQEIQNLAQPKTYDEVVQRDKNENATLESYRDQYVDIAEIKEAQAQKQLLLEYKPEVAKADGNIIGDNFILKENDIKPLSQVSINTNMEEWIKNAADISATSIHADLTKLAQKHPEMFKKPSEAFRLFLQIKNNPTHFLENNREDVVLIAKMINDKKIGKMGVKKDDGEVVHLTNRDIRPKDNKANPHKTLAVEPPTHYHTSAKTEQGDGAKAHSLEQTNDSIKQETNKDTAPITKQQLDQFQILQEAQRAYDKLTTIKYANKDIQKLKESLEQAIKANDKELIKVKQARKSGKSVAETKELLQKHKKEVQNIRTEIRKDIATRQKNIEQGYIDIVSSHHAKIGKKGGYATKMYLETDKKKQSYLYDGFNKESVDNYLQLVKENAPLKERNKALDKLVNERLEAEARFRQLQKQQEELEEKQLQAFDEESFIKSLEGKSEDELENIQGDLWSKGNSKNSDIPFPVIARMQDLVMWIRDKIPQVAFNNDELREAIKSLRSTKEYKDDINSIQYFKKNREYIEQTLNIKPIKEFGTNYAEHYHSGESAIAKLISEAQAHKESGAKGEYKGQVAGAFHRKELGDIDLVWGNSDIGLQKIVEKHTDDFTAFGNGEQGIIKGINEIIENGKLITENGVNTLWYKKDDEYYLVGISKGFNKQGDNNWIITSYKKDNITDLQKEKVDKLFSSDAEVLSAQGKFNELETLNSTTNNIIPQNTTKLQTK
ncbi:hypothetical protein C826_01815 [Helicobacter bilis WiWa]|uniref:Phage-Barnase-EndoU-ColicinE5/D-RelE-like nuclease domain-containing protein n=8 Tax=Helicobacter bilis TaxID=37372 RepID=N2BH22_9HELI|nr:hypothetical protein C826_01815 [Helicobacter bilis WiWa]